MDAAPSPRLDYQRMLMASPNAYAVLSRDLRILEVNPAWMALVGASVNDFTNRYFFDVLPARTPESARELRALFSRVLERGQAESLPLLHYPLPGAAGDRRRWLDRYWTVHVIPLEDAAGRVRALLACPIDLTRHVLEAESGADPIRDGPARQIGAQLARERQHFRQLMQQAPGFVAVGHGPSHVFELVNNAYYQLVGHRDIIGKPVREALPELAGQGFYELLDQVFASGEPFIGRAMPILLQPEPDAPPVQRHIDFIYQPIMDEDGQVSGIFVQGHDVTEAHALATKVAYQAAHDSLTGLLSRREFEQRLTRAVEAQRTEDLPHSLLYLDLDQFKVVNDTCGHAAGDAMLRQIADVLLARMPDAHTLSRLGGDEFGLLLENTGREQANALAEQLREAVEAVEFVHDNRRFGCSASVGVVTFGREIGNMSEALRAADAACLLAKDKGRNRVQVHGLDDQELLERRREMDWVSHLREALAENRMLVHAQRIVALAPGADPRERMELLVRLRDRDGAMVPPMAFIPAAERYGVMPAVDRFVIATAFRHLAALDPATRARTSLSVNLSGRTLSDERLVAFVEELLLAHPFAPGEICFEITETAAVHDLALTTRMLHTLRGLGFRFALDDFGSGMSSFGYLKHLPVDYLKIDGIFIRNLRNDPVDAAMVEAIARVAGAMGIRTVAEYVEDAETAHLLAALGVDYAQGYGVHKPVPLVPAACAHGSQAP